ncbi:DUF4230 domain-containing protein [Streptacidiphilus anmyonensis]|uniref:DUF4230 domain-containing protein n=1 Tax=Streptacidiphilus anmyonensis TaxID=405782 RepID=UPI000A8329E2|nr:DUF4230 domain-containing protein [Streptacidiphilus anmyonensis]
MDVKNRRRVPWYLSIPITIAVIAALFLAAGRFHWLPGLPNPFGEQAVDRSGPAVLQSVQDMSRFEGAAGNFQVVVDLDKEATFMPSALVGSRTLYVAAGSVDSYVDLSHAKVTVSSDRLSASIALPHAQLAGAALDAKHSYIFAQQRGLFDRIGQFFSGNPSDQQALNVLAVNHIQSAAAASGLTTRAQQNTTVMLQGLLKSLGFTRVTVTYQ